jgi:hypothetical protein
VIKIYMLGFHNQEPLSDTPQRQIAEALLTLAGIKEVHDLPNGRRVFTVERIPDNVPMADIFWEEDESYVRNPYHPIEEMEVK